MGCLYVAIILNFDMSYIYCHYCYMGCCCVSKQDEIQIRIRCALFNVPSDEGTASELGRKADSNKKGKLVYVFTNMLFAPIYPFTFQLIVKEFFYIDVY